MAGGCDDLNVSAVSPVPPVRAALGDVLLAAETTATVSPGPSGHVNARAIDKHGWLPLVERRGLGPGRYDIDALAVFSDMAEPNHAGGFREQRVVSADPNVEPWMKLCATLPYKDIAGQDLLSAILFDAEPFRFGVAPVARATACFLVRHDPLLVPEAWWSVNL